MPALPPECLAADDGLQLFLGVGTRLRSPENLDFSSQDTQTLTRIYRQRFAQPPFSEVFTDEEVQTRIQRGLVPEEDVCFTTAHAPTGELIGAAWERWGPLDTLVQEMLTSFSPLQEETFNQVIERIDYHLDRYNLTPACTLFTEIVIDNEHPSSRFAGAALVRRLGHEAIDHEHPTYFGYTSPESNLHGFIKKRGGEDVFPLTEIDPSNPYVVMAGDFHDLIERLT